MNKITKTISVAICILFIFLLNERCKKDFLISKPDSNPEAIFNEAWTVMDQRYSFFTIKNVDWQEQYLTFHSQVNDQMSETELFNVIAQMLEKVTDGHVSLISGFDSSVYTGFYIPYSRNFNFINVFSNYLTDSVRRKGPILYHVIDSVGYLYYGSFNHDVTDAQLDSLFTELEFTQGLIIDVRGNFGGNSENVDRLCRRLIRNNSILYYEKIKTGTGHDDFSGPNPHSVSPAGKPYSKPIVLITNRTCYSACNDLAAFMQTLPYVTVMGDKSGGGGGTPYNYLLANGWKLGYTGSITLSPDYQIIEDGIYPDQFIGIDPIDEIQGIDPIIDSAIHYLHK